jgi:hypothetical protein
MGLLRDNSYDRARLLDAAARARRRNRFHEAITCYERVLAAEPTNPELCVHRAALAVAGDRAWQAYRGIMAVRSTGFADKAIGVCECLADPRTALTALDLGDGARARASSCEALALGRVQARGGLRGGGPAKARAAPAISTRLVCALQKRAEAALASAARRGARLGPTPFAAFAGTSSMSRAARACGPVWALVATPPALNAACPRARTPRPRSAALCSR